MSTENHPDILRKGVKIWNQWGQDNPAITPDLQMASLMKKDLRRADLRGANMEWADLLGSDLSYADMRGANLHGADARDSKFVGADLRGANLYGADNTDCSVYGVSAWNVKLEGAIQQSLVITRPAEAKITVDDLQVAQFIYFILNHANLRNVLNSIAQRGVLILGRFGGGGINVLHTLAVELRQKEYLPIIFDFERPENKNYTETIKTLAGLSRFVIADLSGPSVPMELYATVPFYKIPFVMISERKSTPFSLHKDLLEYDWVIEPVVYFENIKELKDLISPKILAPAEKRFEERKRKLQELFNN